jgi:Arc/MetJ-type ribon-helix-helix transcriptional regulator
MPTSVRLDQNTQARLDRLARATGRSKSSLIREAIARLDADLPTAGSPSTYDRLRRYIGVDRLGPGDRAVRAEEILREGFGQQRKP